MTDLPRAHERLLVIGASGRTGVHVVDAALSRGHHVTALVRDAARFDRVDEQLTVREGDVFDTDAVERAVRSQNAVLCVLGPPRGGPPETCSRGTRNLVTAMQRHGVRRLVVVTGAQIGHPREHLVGLVYRAMAFLLPPSQRALLADRREQERIVRESELDWTLVRPPRLSNEAAGHRVRAAPDLVIDSFAHVGRADLARFLLDVVRDGRFVRQGVAVAY